MLFSFLCNYIIIIMVKKMSKGKIYKIDNNSSRRTNGKYTYDKDDLITFGISILVYAIVLVLASNLFRGIYVENFFYAIIAALILSLLNSTIKPILIYWTLPLSVLTFGIAYPVVNMVILKLCDILMGNAFGVSGFFSTFIIAIFISGMRMLLDQMITMKVGKRK